MFGPLKSIVDVVRSGVADIRSFKSARERKDNVLGILKTYFFLKDCVDEGEALVDDAGPDPIGKINKMDEWKARSTLERWDDVILRQDLRLRALTGFIFGQDHLAVINPALQARISEIIGNKMNQAVTLHRIGAALLFRHTFPIANTNEERAEFVAVMTGPRTRR